MVVHECVPDRWLGWGKCIRRGHLSDTWEYFVTCKLPWKTRYYVIDADEMLVRNRRFILRFKLGWA